MSSPGPSDGVFSSCSAVTGPMVPSSARANVLVGGSCWVLGTACAPWIASTCWASVDG